MKQKSELALKLKKLRKQRGLTSEEVANALGLKGPTYRRYEIDTRPKENVYIAIAKFFNVPVRFLMMDEISCDEMMEQLRFAASGDDILTDDLGDLTRLEAVIVKKLRSVSEDDLEDIIDYIDKKVTRR